jgi:hypothetical protein
MVDNYLAISRQSEVHFDPIRVFNAVQQGFDGIFPRLLPSPFNHIPPESNEGHQLAYQKY